MNRKGTPRRFGERGGVAVEFALIAAIFITLLVGIMETSRVLFYMNTAAEVTRMGARLAVVCDVDAPAIKSKMVGMLGILNSSDISVDYQPAGCSVSTCRSVTVSVAKNINTFIPFVPLTIRMPSFSTTLPRESMTSADNSVCS